MLIVLVDAQFEEALFFYTHARETETEKLTASCRAGDWIQAA